MGREGKARGGRGREKREGKGGEGKEWKRRRGEGEMKEEGGKKGFVYTRVNFKDG